ncbi:mannose-P-dolichol utilization defect 1 protein [Phellopilus nigrolimitatus]|nr:mannose-P-dolichol utilization defect 1 protein [Phellopilus nigrolimitatus]
MTAITQKFPWFIRQPAIALVGEKCYHSLVEELNINDVDCLKFAVSKGLGLGIVVGGGVMKLPQAFIILKARSARGLSFISYISETLSYAITLAYSYRNDFPFSTYGENFFLTLQNALITLGTLPLSVFSKLPQIMSNYRARSTGQLSTFAVVSQIAGCLARLFTTATEVGDSLLFLGFALALAFNCVLGAQMWIYWGADSEAKSAEIGKVSAAEKEKSWDKSGKVDIIVPPASPTPAQGFVTAPTGRRWSRKVD